MYGIEGMAECAPEAQFAFLVIQISKYALCKFPSFAEFYLGFMAIKCHSGGHNAA